MPLRLNVGVSRKLGLENYSSVGASCNIDIELENGLLEHDLEAFHPRVRDAFVVANQAINDELARQQGQQAPAHPAPDGHDHRVESPRGDDHREPRRNGVAHPGRDRGAPRGAGRSGRAAIPRGPASRPRRSRSRRSTPSPARAGPTSRGCSRTSTGSPAPRTCRWATHRSSSTSSRPRPRSESHDDAYRTRRI